jgi:hypothetical protein
MNGGGSGTMMQRQIVVYLDGLERPVASLARSTETGRTYSLKSLPSWMP